MPITRLIAMILSMLNGIMLSGMAYKFFHTYQLNNYRLERMFSWFKNTNSKYMARLAIITFFATGGLVVTNILFRAYLDGLLVYLGMVFYFVIGSFFVVHELRLPKKKPIVFTQRMLRLYVAFLILTTVSTYFLFVGTYELGRQYGDVALSLRYAPISLTPVGIPLFFTAVALVLKPFEGLNNRRYIARATAELKERSDLIKIGITGSYAKTSVKFILEKMLSQRYETLATPASYNTPLGIAKCTKNLKPAHQVFIAEMGARSMGDVHALASMVRPRYMVITGIAGQHLETFHTMENIVKAKSEIFDFVDGDSLAVFNGDNPYVKKMHDSYGGDKMITTTERSEGSYAYAENIRCGRNGSRFTLHIGSESAECATRLLGRHHISNVVLCAGLAHKLGVDIADIAQAIAELKPVAHRLELIHNRNGITVIDDSFNANVEGTKAALEVLSMFEGRKVVITPGLVELGENEREENRAFGERMASCCDLAVLIGKVRTEPILKGLLGAGFEEGNIMVFNSLSEAKRSFKEFLRQGDTVLIENDLPDHYSEIDG